MQTPVQINLGEHTLHSIYYLNCKNVTENKNILRLKIWLFKIILYYYISLLCRVLISILLNVSGRRAAWNFIFGENALNRTREVHSLTHMVKKD